jgi:hypothetical protein
MRRAPRPRFIEDELDPDEDGGIDDMFFDEFGLELGPRDDEVELGEGRA